MSEIIAIFPKFQIPPQLLSIFHNSIGDSTKDKCLFSVVKFHHLYWLNGSTYIYNIIYVEGLTLLEFLQMLYKYYS